MKSRVNVITSLLILAAFLTIADINIVTGQTPQPPLEVDDLSITPNVLKRNVTLTSIIAVLVFPEGIKASDIEDELLVLNPGNIVAIGQQVTEKDGSVEITAVFDMAELMNIVPDDHYGPFDLEVTGKLKSGQIFSGEDTINIFQAEDASDYISYIYITQTWNYGNATDINDLTYEFYLEIYAYDYMAINMNIDVNSVEFLTPAGNTFQIPKLPSQWSDNIWKSYQYEYYEGGYDPDWWGADAMWIYKARFTDLADLQAYGDGEYTIILHHIDGSKNQTTAWFGIPDTNEAIPQPTQEPVLTFPLHGQVTKSPVTFNWEPCTDTNATEIWIDVDELGTIWLGDKWEDFDVSEASWGPVYMPDGIWEADIVFDRWISNITNNDGIWTGAAKSSKSRSRFTVEGSPWIKYEVWGGDTWIDYSSKGSYGDIADVEMNGYVKLGESDGPSATFSDPNQYQYYLVATIGEFLLDSIQGSDGSYYSSFEANSSIANISDDTYLLGEPDGQCAIVGVSNPWDDFSGYIVFSNPDNWEGLTVITSDFNLNLSKSIVGDVNEIESIDPNDNITYRINFDSNDFAQDITDVTVVDILPDEVSFVSADSNEVSGTYDPDKHTYTWSYPSLAPESVIEMQLTVQVNPDVAPGTTITNFVTINSNETPPSTASIDAAVSYQPLNITKKAVDSSGSEIQWIYPGKGKSFIYQICFDNNNNGSQVTGVFISDTLPSEVNFVDAQVDSNNFIWGYDPQNHSYIGALKSMDPGLATCLKITVEVNQDTPNMIINNTVTITSNETPQSMADVGVEVIPPLEVEDLIITPNVLRRNGTSKYITAVVKFPAGLQQSEIDPDNIPELYYQDRDTGDFILIGNGSRPVLSGTQITTLFDRAELMDAIYGYGEFTLKVVGQLKSSLTFYGYDTILITRFAGD